MVQIQRHDDKLVAYESSLTPFDATWYHIGMTYSASTGVKLYKNGDEVKFNYIWLTYEANSYHNLKNKINANLDKNQVITIFVTDSKFNSGDWWTEKWRQSR